MSHVDDGQLNALLDGELSGAEARAVESHVATCGDCRRRLEEARAFLHEANTLLDSMSPLAAGSPGPAVAGEPGAREPARPSRQSVPVRPVGSLADLPGGEAGSVRPPAPPASRPPMAPATSAPVAKEPPRKVMKTAREVAVDIDGRTAMTPGISPLFADEPAAALAAERARPPRRGWDLEKLAWAANIVLALGVGYLSNEVRWMHSARELPQARVDTVLLTAPARDVVRAPSAAAPTQSTAAPGRSAALRNTARPTQIASATRTQRPTGGARHSAASLSKPPAARGPKAAPTATRPAPLGDLAARQARPADAISGAERQGPANAPAAAQPSRADLETRGAQGAGVSGGAPAPAPRQPQAAAQNLAANRYARTSALDEAAVRPTPGFTRITMEEAVRTLSSSIRQIDGMTPISIEAAGGRLVAGSDPSREVVRVNYTDQYGRHFTLDQQLAEPRAGRAFNGIIPGDTLVAPTADGGSRVRWLDGKFWLSLSGPVPGNEIRALVGRVR